jgi:hypothetical protein
MPDLDNDIARMVWGLRDNAEDLFRIWMFQPARRAEFGRKEIDDIRNTVVGLNAILMQHDKQNKPQLVTEGFR